MMKQISYTNIYINGLLNTNLSTLPLWYAALPPSLSLFSTSGGHFPRIVKQWLKDPISTSQKPPHRCVFLIFRLTRQRKYQKQKFPMRAHRCLFTEFNWRSYSGLFYVVLNKISLQQIAKTIYRVYYLHLLSLKTCLSASMKMSKVLASNYYNFWLNLTKNLSLLFQFFCHFN